MPTWRRFYEVANQESDPTKLKDLVDEAETAICQCLGELDGNSDTAEELLELTKAFVALIQWRNEMLRQTANIQQMHETLPETPSKTAHTYDVFSGQPNDGPLWIGAADGLAEAVRVLSVRGAQKPGPYFIMDLRTHAVLVCVNTKALAACS